MNQITSEFISFWTALRRYGQLIIAKLRLEEERRRRAPFESFAYLLEPVALFTALSLVFLLMNRNAASWGESETLFLGTGIFAKFFFIHVSSRDRWAHRRYPVEQWLDDLIVNIILKVFDFTLFGVALFGGMAIFGVSSAIPRNLLPILQAVVCMIMLGFGWGIFSIVMAEAFGIPAFIFSGINRLSMMIEGTLFIVDYLPPESRYLVSFNPLTHVIILFRQGFYPDYPSLTLDTSYLIYCSIFAILLGFVLERATRRLRVR